MIIMIKRLNIVTIVDTNSMNKNLIVIVGPTAIGKTALSIALAKYFNTEIISTDSRQIFKEMSIGTAVPSKVELDAATHHFIQHKSIFDTYSVGDYEVESIKLLDELFKKHDTLIAVGGSGLYVNTLLNGLDEFPETKPGIRAEMIKKYEENGLEFLTNSLQKLDCNYFNFLSENNPQTLKNPQRLMRFLEVCISSGQPYSSFIDKKKIKRNFNPIVIGLQADREVLYERINKRVDIMMNDGLLEEAKSLHPHKNLNALQTVGYKELFDYFDGLMTDEDAVEKIKQNTRNFAKRQMTWFKKNKNTKWFDFEEDIKNIINYIKNQINA